MASPLRSNAMVCGLVMAVVAVFAPWSGRPRTEAITQGRWCDTISPLPVGCAMTTSDTCPGVGIVEVGWHLRLASGSPHDPQRPDQPAKSPAPQSPQPGPQPVVTLALEAPTLLLGRDVSVTLLRIDPHPRKSSVQLAVERPHWQTCIRRVAEGENLTLKFRQHTYTLAVLAVNVEDQHATVQMRQDTTPSPKPTC